MGLKPYTAREVTVTTIDGTGEVKDFNGFATATLNSNYPMCILRTVVVDEAGNETQIAVKFLDKRDVRKGTARKFPMGNYSDVLDSRTLEQYLEAGKTYTMRLDVTVSSGEVITPISFQITG